MIMRLTLAITALVLCGARVQAETVYTPGKPGAVSYEKFGLDFLEYHCLDCHDSATKKGDLSLEDIIDNLERDGDHYARANLSLKMGERDALYAFYNDAATRA